MQDLQRQHPHRHTGGQLYRYVPSNGTTQPSDTLSVSPVSSLAAPFNGLYIQGRTKAKITHTASGKYGATIKSYAATVDGQTYTGQAPTTEILATPGTLTITGTATDSRGIVGTALASIAVLAYTPPSVERNTSTDALVCARALANGTLDDDGTALYVACSRKYSALNGNNAASVQVRYKAESGEWSDWVTFFAESASGDNYAGIVTGITLAIEFPYAIELRAVDNLGESGGTLSFAVPTSEATVDLGEGGNSLGVGRRAHVGTEKRLDVAWDSNFEKDVRVDGDLSVQATDLGKTPPKVAVLDSLGVLYYRTPEELKSDLPYGDYVVEQGASGIWTYRKWYSGIAECWLSTEQSLTCAAPKSLMGGYYSSVDLETPFTFTSYLGGVGDSALGTGVGFTNVRPKSSNSKISVYSWGNQNVATINIFAVYLFGRWK